MQIDEMILCEHHSNGEGKLLHKTEFYRIRKKGNECKECAKKRIKNAYHKNKGNTLTYGKEVKLFSHLLIKRWRNNNAIYPIHNVTYYGHWD